MPDTTSNLPASTNPAQPIRCRHIKVDGTQCGCPALRGRLLCHFHFNWQVATTTTVDDFASFVEDYRNKDQSEFVRQRTRPLVGLEKAEQQEFLQAEFIREQCENAPLLMPALEDANSIQVALMRVMRLLLANAIPYKTAGLLLYALQTASANLSRVNFEPVGQQVITVPLTTPAHLPGDIGKHEHGKADSPDGVSQVADNQMEQSQRAADQDSADSTIPGSLAGDCPSD